MGIKFLRVHSNSNKLAYLLEIESQKTSVSC